MKVRQVRIHNFRGIHEEGVRLFDYNLLVGPNNAGKSTVIDAIRAFYEKERFGYKHDRDFPFIATKDKESWIELTFGLTDEENASLAEIYRQEDKTLTVRKYFKCRDKNKEGYIYARKTDGEFSDESFYGAKNVQSGKFGDIVFVPAVSKVDEHAKLSGPSALRDLLTNVLGAVVSSNPSYEKLSTDFEEFSQSVRTEKTSDGRSLEGLEAELSQLLEAWDATFRLDMKSPSMQEIIKTLVSYQCVDKGHGKPIAADQFGSGFQRHFIYSVIQLGAKYIGKKVSKKAKDFTPSMSLLLFEEPEAFLHPPQQEILSQSLNQLARNPDQQVICSTHSSHFVSRNSEDIQSLSRLKRESGRVRAFQIDPVTWHEIVNANQALNKIAEKWPELKKRLGTDDWKTEMEVVKYALWLNPDRCGMFFANHVLIVEGPSEKAFINKLVDDGKINPSGDGLYVLDALGKFNVHRFMNLLARLGISHSVLYDADKSKDWHEDLNQLVESSKHDGLTKAIGVVLDDLESFLKIPPARGLHRKPQHILYLYGSGQIDPARISSFCDLVHSCLPKNK